MATDLSKLAGAIRTACGKDNPDILFNPKGSIQFIPTGCFTFDLVAGGGIPRGRISEVFGMEHSGKTAIALSAHRNVQKMGGVGIHIDFENAFDPKHAKKVYGIEHNGKTFIVINPLNLEEGSNAIDAIMESGLNIDLISIDSVDAMKPKALIEGSLDQEARVGAQAKGVGRVVSKLRVYAMQSKCAILFINQMRVNINTSKFEQNIGTGSGYNVMETHTVPGGYALRFYASLRMKLEFGGQIKDEKGENSISGEDEKQRIGQLVKVINIKNKVSNPFKKSVANFMYPLPGQRGGWSEGHDCIAILTKRGYIRQAGTKFIYQGLNIPEWSNIGSKKASTDLFIYNEELVADAKALIHKLIAEEEAAEDAEYQRKFGENGTGHDNPLTGRAESILEELGADEIKEIKAGDQKGEEAMSMSDLAAPKAATPFAPAAVAKNPFAPAPAATSETAL